MEPSAIQSGTVIDRYTVESVVGEGGMAVVFRVRHNTLGTLHALKVLTLSSRQIRERLRQEGQFQATLQHPNVVAVTDVLDLGGTDALIMEYVDGPSLDGLMRQQRLTIAQADELAAGIFAGVAEAHRLGYVHRDLKPGNVLLKPSARGYQPKVTDFGLAKAFGGGSDPGRAQTRTGSTMGTPHYMSPEQVRDSKNVGPRSDIFSLGAVLYEMIAGRRAFEGSDLLEIFNAVASASCPPIRSLVPDVPLRIELAIQAAMQTDPRERPETVEALAAIWRGTNGITLAPGSAFDLPALPAGPLPPFRGAETWAAAETLPDSAPPTTDSANPTLSPPAASLPTARVAWVVGLGGGMVLTAAAAALILLLTVGGAWWWYGAAEAPIAAIAPLGLPAPVLVEVEPVEEAPEAVVPGGEEVARKPAGPLAEAAPPPAEQPPLPEAEAEAPPQAVVVAATETEAEEEPPPAERSEPPPAAEAPGPELVGMQASDDPNDREKAVQNLAKRADDEAIVLLGHFVRSDPSPVVRNEAWVVVFDRYLARFGDVGLLEEIVVWQMGRGSPHQSTQAVEAFGRYGTDPELLVEAIRHSSAGVRELVATVLPRVAARANEDVDYEALLAPLLGDAEPAVQRRATQALADLAGR